MKIISLILSIFIFLITSKAQTDTLITKSGAPLTRSTCIFDIKLAHFQTVDSTSVEFFKPAVENLLDHLRGCKPKYKYSGDFEDRSIQLRVPNYFNTSNLFIGDQKFNLQITSEDSLKRVIVFGYDFDGSYKKHFLTTDSLGFQKTGVQTVNSQEIHRFINWDNRYAGTIFLTPVFNISYFTRSKGDIDELEQTISRFSW